MFVGQNAGVTGEYELTAGWLDTREASHYFGMSGKGMMTQTGGANTLSAANSYVTMGQYAGAEGAYTLSGGALVRIHSVSGKPEGKIVRSTALFRLNTLINRTRRQR